jgi:hypothetical protein
MTLTSPVYNDGAYGMVYTITDASGVTVATGNGTAGSWASDDTDLCLPTGCYDLAVSSAYCCNTSYGWAFMGLSGDAGTGSANISIGGATCAILGCTDSTATNYNASATTDDGSCTYPCLLDEVTLTLTDSYGDTWNGGTLTIDGVTYDQPTTASGGASDTYTLCVDLSTCIDVTYSAGSYSSENSWSISDASGAVLASAGNVSGQIGACIVLVDGCTDSTALNYDPLANNDDGSCVFCVYGCTDSIAINYDALATCDDASCIAPINGCTDSTALNYYPGANIDDGNCCFVSGCTDDLYTEYDALACIDDGSCATLVNQGSCNYDSPTGAYTSALIHDRVTMNWDNMNDANCMVEQYRFSYLVVLNR